MLPINHENTDHYNQLFNKREDLVNKLYAIEFNILTFVHETDKQIAHTRFRIQLRMVTNAMKSVGEAPFKIEV